MPDWLAGSLFSGGGWLAFADPNHGWLALGSGLTAESQGGAVLATSDGGKSWEYTDTPDSVAGPMVMVTPQFGWLVGGGAGNDELLVTRDGAKTWQTVELESPVKTDLMRKYDRNLDQFEQSFYQALPPAAAKLARKEPQHRFYAAYDLPTFEDPKHGYVCVTYPGVVVLFATEDGGVTWKPDRVLTGLQDDQMGGRWCPPWRTRRGSLAEFQKTVCLSSANSARAPALRIARCQLLRIGGFANEFRHGEPGLGRD